MKSVIIKKESRGTYLVTINGPDGQPHDSAGFVSQTDALRWAAEFLPLLEPFDASNSPSR